MRRIGLAVAFTLMANVVWGGDWPSYPPVTRGYEVGTRPSRIEPAAFRFARHANRSPPLMLSS